MKKFLAIWAKRAGHFLGFSRKKGKLLTRMALRRELAAFLDDLKANADKTQTSRKARLAREEALASKLWLWDGRDPQDGEFSQFLTACRRVTAMAQKEPEQALTVLISTLKYFEFTIADEKHP